MKSFEKSVHAIVDIRDDLVKAIPSLTDSRSQIADDIRDLQRHPSPNPPIDALGMIYPGEEPDAGPILLQQ